MEQDARDVVVMSAARVYFPCLIPYGNYYTNSSLNRTNITFASFIRQSLICLSSAPETINGKVGWKQAQFTPRSWPSKTCFTKASACPKRSVALGFFRCSSRPPGPGATFFLRKPTILIVCEDCIVPDDD